MKTEIVSIYQHCTKEGSSPMLDAFACRRVCLAFFARYAAAPILFLFAISLFGQPQQVTLGSSTIAGTVDSNSSGLAEAFPVTASSSGQINSLSLFLDGSNAAATVWVGLYSSHFGQPQILLSEAVLSQPNAGAWNTIQIPSAQVTSGTRYWLAILGVKGQIAFRDAAGNCSSQTSLQTGLTSLPSSWTTGSRWQSCIVSMFGTGSGGNIVSVTVAPATASIQEGQQQQFGSTVIGTSNTAVTWTSSGGTISSSGQYIAPSVAGTYRVTATSVADTTKFATAAVTVPQPLQVVVSVSPGTASVASGGQQQFNASVTGSSNTTVSWSASSGRISSSGLYVAPALAGTYAVTATSSADATKSASATITVAPPPQVSITVSPGTASVASGGQQQFNASVTGSSNTAVTWFASSGTVSSNGLYVAPALAGTYAVTATSAADPTKSASATITVAPPPQVSITVSPGTASVASGGQQQFSASVTGSSNTAVAWFASSGTVSSSGLYVAPALAGTYAVTATSSADPTKSASATITVAPPPQVSITISPGTASVAGGGQQQFTAYVTGSSNTAANWSASAGTVGSSGLYVAPISAGTYLVTATSAADPTKSAAASITVAAAQNVSVSISPTSTAMPEKWQQQFAATVSGSSNTAVTWTVSQGNGSVTQSGLFTSPLNVETDVVTAISQADSTKSASASITVVKPHSVNLTWSQSASNDVSYYKVYRATVSGGPFSLLASNLIATSYVDSSVQSGITYFYVTTAVDTTGMESANSNLAQAGIPVP
jgi:hypothetical protein